MVFKFLFCKDLPQATWVKTRGKLGGKAFVVLADTLQCNREIVVSKIPTRHTCRQRNQQSDVQWIGHGKYYQCEVMFDGLVMVNTINAR